MVKSIVRLLAAAFSFVALLFSTNSAFATTPVDNGTQQANAPVTSLNLVSPALLSFELDSVDSHLGCTCAVCTATLEQNRK